MSTKTTIKRVALVAAVALTLGGFSAVSASAASASTIAQVAGTGDNGVGAVAGPANSVQVLVTVDPTVSPRKGYVTVSGGTITSAVSGAVIAANGLSAVVSASDSLTISTPTAGSIVITEYDATSASNFSSTASVTKTITVNATAISGTYSVANSSVYLVSGDTNTAVSADSAAITFPNTAATVGETSTGGHAAATIQVVYRDANGSNITNDSITATIVSGPGTIAGYRDSATATTIANAIQYSSSVTSQNGAANFVIWANGQTGVSTITVKNSAGTVLATKTLTFASTTPASIKVKVLKAYVSNAAVSVNAFAYNVYDSAGNEIKALTTAPTVAVATGVTANGSVLCGTTYDTTNGYFTCAVTATAATTASAKDLVDAYTFTAVTGVTTTASVNYVSPVAATVTVKGPDSASPGDKITYTFTALNANGNPIPDAAYAPGTFIASVSPSANLVSNPFGATSSDTITTVAGVATASTYAPYGGTLTLTWTLSGTAGVANSALAKTLTATTVAATTTIAGSADSALAVDAANAATDAANAAAEEASNATEAASEALAAVNALATTVASLIAGIKAQLTALTALVKKLQK
jgi:hypothetical protein